MNAKMKTLGKYSRLLLPTVTVVLLAAATFLLVQCGGGASPGTGSATVTMSDPPNCTPPFGNVQGVWITVSDVKAHRSANASPNEAGWIDLTPNLTGGNSAMQLNLLNLFTPTTSVSCVLATLGSASGIPAGSYQQLRLLLVDNGATSPPTLTGSNACTTGGLSAGTFNCVEVGGTFYPLDLSSQDQTGLKVASGQILGGPITVPAGGSIDININFNACASIVQEAGGTAYRLNPVLTAQQVTPQNHLTGQVVINGTATGIPGALVAVETADPLTTGVDKIVASTTTDSNGNFVFCPLSLTGTFDVVADAVTGSGMTEKTYNATVILNVPSSTITIPLVAESMTVPSTPASIAGTVTSKNGGGTATSITATVSALESVPADGGTLLVSIPLLSGTSPASGSVMTTSGSCPTSTDCATYTLVVPASNPKVGTFSSGTITFNSSTPASPPVNYQVGAETTASCTPQFLDTSAFAVTAGTTTTAPEIDFTGCP